MEQFTPLINGYPANSHRRVLGLISGTSADGVDVACVEFFPPNHRELLKVLSFSTVAYSSALKERVLEAAADKLSLRQTAILHTELGEFFGEAARSAAQDHDCCLVASHGQTVCHLPESQTTLQLGDGAIIANRTRLLTVTDFRTADLALGGQGAPLVPLFDRYLLASQHCQRVAVNLGGIANITLLSREGKTVRAWDTGPANCVSDALCRLHKKGDYDPNGETAQAGTVDDKLLRQLLEHPYFILASPKSTGLEDFGEHFARSLPPTLSLADKLRTVIALSAETLARSIADNLEKDQSSPAEIVVAGGGVRNQTLLQEFDERLAIWSRKRGLPLPKRREFSEFGVSEDAREAVAFAYLGDRTMRGLSGTLPSTTGASRPAILGKVSFPSAL